MESTGWVCGVGIVNTGDDASGTLFSATGTVSTIGFGLGNESEASLL